jgi:hypothetical protein
VRVRVGVEHALVVDVLVRVGLTVVGVLVRVLDVRVLVRSSRLLAEQKENMSFLEYVIKWKLK